MSSNRMFANIRYFTDIQYDLMLAIRSRDRTAIRRLMAERRSPATQIAMRRLNVQKRIKAEFCNFKRHRGKNHILFSKKYDIYTYKRIIKDKDYKNHFKQSAKEAQRKRHFHRAALLRYQSSVSSKNFDPYKQHRFETLIEWNTINNIKAKDIPLSFMIKRKGDFNKNILFIIPYNYPVIPPRIFINGTPIRSQKSNDDIKIHIGKITFMVKGGWWFRYGIENCVKLFKGFLDEIPLKNS